MITRILQETTTCNESITIKYSPQWKIPFLFNSWRNFKTTKYNVNSLDREPITYSTLTSSLEFLIDMYELNEKDQQLKMKQKSTKITRKVAFQFSTKEDVIKAIEEIKSKEIKFPTSFPTSIENKS